MSNQKNFELISDLHKDARGRRPGKGFWADWQCRSQAEKQAIWDGLCEELQRSEQRRLADEANAAIAFEKNLAARMQAYPAISWEMAIRMLAVENNAFHPTGNKGNGYVDDGYLGYCLGLPYGFIAKARKQRQDAGVDALVSTN
jgi:hypothetical protein